MRYEGTVYRPPSEAGSLIIRIDSLDDSRLEAYTRLTERQLRCVLEPEKGKIGRAHV